MIIEESASVNRPPTTTDCDAMTEVKEDNRRSSLYNRTLLKSEKSHTNTLSPRQQIIPNSYNRDKGIELNVVR